MNIISKFLCSEIVLSFISLLKIARHIRVILSRLLRECLKTGYNIKEFLIDGTLPQAVEPTIQILKHFFNIFFGPLHCRQPARVFTGQGFSAGPVEGDEKIFTDQCPQGQRPPPEDLGNLPRRPGKSDQVLLPGSIKRQETSAERR